MSNTGKQRKSKKTLKMLYQQGIENCEQSYLYGQKWHAELDSEPSNDASLNKRKRATIDSDVALGIAFALEGLPPMTVALITAHFVSRAMSGLSDLKVYGKVVEDQAANIVMLGKVGVAVDLMLKKIDEAPAKARQANAKKAAAASHEPHKQTKRKATEWLDTNRARYKSIENMATLLTMSFEIAPSTARRYVREWRDRSQLAEESHSK